MIPKTQAPHQSMMNHDVDVRNPATESHQGKLHTAGKLQSMMMK